MKKLLFVLVLFFGTRSIAQEFNWGPRFGVSLASISLSDMKQSAKPYISEASPTLSYHIGAFTRIQFSNFYVQQEFLYTHIKAEQFENKFVSESGFFPENNVSIHRIDIPVLIGAHISKKVRVQVGSVFNIPISNEVGGLENDQYNIGKIGYQAGLGIDLKKLLIDLKYEGHFSDISNNIYGTATKQRLSQVILSIGWKI